MPNVGAELASVPFGKMIYDMASAIARSQVALDKASIELVKVIPFTVARGNSKAIDSLTVSATSKFTCSMVIFPASIFDKSRISLMMDNKASALVLIVVANSRCSGDKDVSHNRLIMPMTPFIGVRISWLIFARNSLLALAAIKAVSAIF